MAENYKHLYEQTKKMLTMYQDELIPGFRKKIEELEADNERLRCMWADAVSKASKAEVLKVEANFYDKEEIFLDCTVQVLTNTATGDVSVGWWKND